LDFRSRDLKSKVSRPRPWTSGLETETEILDFRSRDRDLDKMNSSVLESRDMVSRSHHWLHQFQLVTEHSLKGAANYGNRATGVGTKHAVLRPRPRPGSSGLETKTETLAIRSRDRDLDKMNLSALESRDHGLEITILPAYPHCPGRPDVKQGWQEWRKYADIFTATR